MAIKTVTELQAKPGGRDALVEVMEGMADEMGRTPGFIGASRFAVFDEPDLVVEIAEWESADARSAWLAQATEKRTLMPLMKALADLPRTRVLHDLD